MMANTRITLKGKPIKEPKIKEDGVVELVFKNEMGKNVPYGLQSLGASVYYVQVSPMLWQKVAHCVTETAEFKIEGEPKAKVSPKNAPYIAVVTFAIEVFEPKHKPNENQLENTKAQQPFLRWFDLPQVKDNVIKVSANQVKIVNKEHFVGYNVNLSNSMDIQRTVIAKPNGDGTYNLTVGFTNYVCAKTYDLPLYVYAYEGTKEEFAEEFNIEYMRTKAIKKHKNRNKKKASK